MALGYSISKPIVFYKAFWEGLTNFVLDGYPIDLGKDKIFCMLLTSDYEPSVENHQYLLDVSNYEVNTSSRYSEGGFLMRIYPVIYDGKDSKTGDTVSNILWKASPIVFYPVEQGDEANAFDNARFAILYKEVRDQSGSLLTASSPLIGYLDFGYEYTNLNAVLRVDFEDSGFLKISR